MPELQGSGTLVHVLWGRLFNLPKHTDGFGSCGNVADLHEVAVVDLAQLAAAKVLRRVVDEFFKRGTLVIRTVGIADKLEVHPTLPQGDFLATEPFSNATNRHDLQQFLALDGNRAEAVDEPLAIVGKRAIVLDGVEFAVENHPFLRARHVVVGEIHREVALESAVGDVGCPLQPPPTGGGFCFG